MATRRRVLAASIADALAGVPLAGLAGAPLLLAGGDGALWPETAAQMRRLRPARVRVLGGTAALPASVEDAVLAAMEG